MEDKIKKRIEKLKVDKIYFELESLKNSYTSYGIEMHINKLKCEVVIEELESILRSE